MLASLAALDIDSPEFEVQFAAFKQAVTQHAESEEEDEFPALESAYDEAARRDLGRRFVEVFNSAGGKV